MKLMRKDDVVRVTGLSISTIDRLEKKGEFPKRRKISERLVAWTEDEIKEWIEGRKDERLSG